MVTIITTSSPSTKTEQKPSDQLSHNVQPLHFASEPKHTQTELLQKPNQEPNKKPNSISIVLTSPRPPRTVNCQWSNLKHLRPSHNSTTNPHQPAHTKQLSFFTQHCTVISFIPNKQPLQQTSTFQTYCNNTLNITSHISLFNCDSKLHCCSTAN